MAADGQRNGAGGGAGSTYPMRMILTGKDQALLATPRKTDADRGGRVDVLSQLRGYPSRHAGMLPTPVKNDGKLEPWSEAYARRRSPKLDAMMDKAMTDVGQMPTPRASDMKAGGHGDTGRMGTVKHQLQQALLPTPLKRDMMGGPRYDPDGKRGISMREIMSPKALDSWEAQALETLPTPTKRDKRLDSWSPAYDRRKSPTMDAVLDGAMTDRASSKWAGARALATLLQSHGLTGTAALPITYGWMMGYPPGWLSRALQLAVREGLLQHPSSSKRSATQSSRKYRKP